MALLRSLAFSLLASALATMAARRMLSVSHPTGEGNEGKSPGTTIVVVMPVLVGNSSNRIGWVKEVHHRHYSLLGRGRG